MGYTAEGTIEIPLEEFWKFVSEYTPSQADEIRYGVPRVNKGTQCMEIDFALSSDNSPDDWMVKPEAITQWEKLE